MHFFLVRFEFDTIAQYLIEARYHNLRKIKAQLAQNVADELSRGAEIMLAERDMIWSLGHDARSKALIKSAFGDCHALKFFDTLGAVQTALKDSSPWVLISEYAAKDGVILELAPKKFPIFVLSSEDKFEIIRQCLTNGISDYLLHPVNKNLLRAKVECLIHRSLLLDKRGVSDLSVNPVLHLLERGGSSVELTRKEVRIMLALLQDRGRGATRSEITHAAWKDVTVVSKTFDVHLFNLRRKIRVLGVEIRYGADGRYVLGVTVPSGDASAR